MTAAPTPREVIRRAMDKRRAAAHGGCFVSAQDDADACVDGTCACARTLDRDAAAILAALAAAPAETRVALARTLLQGTQHAAGPREPTPTMILAGYRAHYDGPVRPSVSGDLAVHWRAMLAAAQEADDAE